MLDAMWHARVGDDVFGEDPTVNELEDRVAAYFGKEAALYCPTGTMSNQIGIKVHTQPGDEVICDRTAHVYQYEGGGIAFNAGCQVHLLEGNRGLVTAAQVEAAINADDVHKARTSLVCLENTANRGGGSCYDMEEITRIREVCLQHNLLLHLDGARLFNALRAKKQQPQHYGELFNSISVCFNKGLGCPIGSVLTGSRDFIRKARRVRKVFGGGMRQAGYMAAAALYALDQHIERLDEDHAHAKMVAATLLKKDFVASVLPVETNIVIFSTKVPPKEVTDKLQEQQILAIPISATQVRFVFHLDVTREMVDKTIHAIDAMQLEAVLQ
jgi:threonine aldolase